MPWEASDTVPRSSTKSSPSRFRQPVAAAAAARLCSTTKHLNRRHRPVVRYPAGGGGAQGQVHHDRVRDRALDDVAVRSRAVPTRAHVHDHVRDRAQDARAPPIPPFHCVSVRHRWPSPVGRKVSSAVERRTTVPREERPTRASPKAVCEIE